MFCAIVAEWEYKTPIKNYVHHRYKRPRLWLYNLQVRAFVYLLNSARCATTANVHVCGSIIYKSESLVIFSLAQDAQQQVPLDK
jgi:hypothetical protein